MLVAACVASLALATAASATTIADAPTVLVDGPVVAGAVKDAQSKAFYAIDLQLAQRVEVTIDAPLAGGLTARFFRPGVDDATLTATTPRNVLSLAKGVTARTFSADWPGRWILEITGPSPTPYSVSVKGIAPGTPGEVVGSTTVAQANGMVVGTRYFSSTLDPANPPSTNGRFAWVEAAAGDRVEVQVAATNGKPFTAEAFRPGVTDATVDTEDPVATITSTGASTLAFNADMDGEWIIRVMPAADDAGIIKPTTFTAVLASVTPRDPATTCVDDVTDIGLTNVRGCVTTKRNAVTATGVITMSGVVFTPATAAPLRIDPKTLEVRSDGDFSVDILGTRMLTATRYFHLDSTHTFTVPENTELYGLPVKGSVTVSWSLVNEGTVTVDGTVGLPKLGVDGRLAFSLSGDDEVLHGLHVRVAVEYLYGTAFTGSLTYRRELSDGVYIDVWRGDLSLSFGVAKPQWLLDREADAAINDQITDGTAPGADALSPLAPTTTDDAKGAELTASLIGAAGALEFRDGRLAYLRGAVNTNIPVGATGLVVTQLGAALRWSPHVMLSGNGTIALGPDVNGVSALSIAGYVGWANGGSCPGSAVSSPNWFGGGTATIAGWFSILSLDACYQQADTAFTVIKGTSGFGIPNILTGSARFDGYVYGKQAMMIEATGAMDIWGTGVEGRLVLSNAGYAACGATYVHLFGMKRRLEIGAEGPWKGGKGKAGFSCPDFAPYLTVPVARAARTDGVPVTVPKGVDQVNLLVRGAGGVTGVDIVAPDGTVVAQSASTTEPTLAGAVFAPRAETGEMQIALPIVQAGTYLIRAQAGGTIASVQTSLPRPDVTVRARVVRVGGKRVLRYTITGLDGRSVRFVDTARGTGRLLATVRSATGTLPLRGPGVHRVTAAVIDEQGLAQAPVAVARYRARA